jgi:hypothetical protein
MSSDAIPTPVSATVKLTASLSPSRVPGRSCSATVPVSVYLIAFDRRFVSTCSSRSRSTSTAGGSGPVTSSRSARPFRMALSRISLGHVFREPLQIDRRGRERVRLRAEEGQLQDVVDQLQERLGRPAGGAGGRRAGGPFLLGQFERAEQADDGRADVMRERREEPGLLPVAPLASPRPLRRREPHLGPVAVRQSPDGQARQHQPEHRQPERHRRKARWQDASGRGITATAIQPGATLSGWWPTSQVPPMASGPG